MNASDIEQKLYEIIQEFFELPADFPLNRETRAFDIDGWDSLAHATLLISIRQELGVKLDHDEAAGVNNVGDLHGLVVRHCDVD